MTEEYAITIHEAIELYNCLASMRIGAIEISVNSEHTLNAKHSKHQFSVKGTSGKYALVDYDEICFVTLKDYLPTITDFTARQLRIVTFIAAQKAAKIFDLLLAKKRKEWEAELDDTVIIPIIDLEDEDSHEMESKP